MSGSRGYSFCRFRCRQSIGNHDKQMSQSNCETQAAFIVHYHNSDTRAEKATKGEILVTKRRRIASRHGSKKTWVALPNCRQGPLGRKAVGPGLISSSSTPNSVSRKLCHDTAIRHYCGGEHGYCRQFN